MATARPWYFLVMTLRPWPLRLLSACLLLSIAACATPIRSGGAAPDDVAALDAGGAAADPESAAPIPDDVTAAAAPDLGTGARHPEPPEKLPVPLPSLLMGIDRWVAIGDLHGDLEATRTALQLAGAIDQSDAWIGGDLVVVQVGDQLDRGDDERAILELLQKLAADAHEQGGAVIPLLGNHETMNVDEDFRYVTPGGWLDFADVPHDPADPKLAGYLPTERGRVSAFLPGGTYATVLSTHKIAVIVGDTVFVHGGLLPHHAAMGLQALNEPFGAWLAGDGPRPELTTSDDSPVWIRQYSDSPDEADCALLQETLDALGAARMVVGHTVQAGMTSECGGKVWLVDVGLAAHYGGTAAVLVYVEGELWVQGLYD